MNASSRVIEHYENHLAPIYAWMVGDFDEACEANANLFDDLKISANQLEPSNSESHPIALDLGCGHGIHAVPLATRGFQVIAIDTSRLLLSELQAKDATGRIQTVQDDLLHFAEHHREPVNLILCMGDTITHLPSHDQVEKLLRLAYHHLRPQGYFCVSFRDYVTHELQGADRFIPVRSDLNRIHTCFLEYHEQVVEVHDVIHTRRGEEWETAISAYPKLRIAPQRITELATRLGFTLHHHSDRRGMLHMTFAKRMPPESPNDERHG